jgi:arylsulfatase A-like enzyme
MTNTHKPIDRVVIVVFDGLRADMVTPELTPNILRVVKKGSWYRQARTIFPSVTRVASTSLATGAHPLMHGIVGNGFYFPQALPDRILDTGKAEHIRTADHATQGAFVTCETIGDVLAKHGKTMSVIHAGSAGSTYCVNPRAHRHGHWTFSVGGHDNTPTPHVIDEVVSHFGPLPEAEVPKIAAQSYLAKIAIEKILPQKSDVTLIWFSEPDTSYHYLEIGSQGARKALINADANLGLILDYIETLPDHEKLALVIASDHGQISTRDAIPLFEQARAAGFPIAPKNALAEAKIIGAGGSSGELRVPNGDQKTLSYLAHWLMDHEHISHVFSKDLNGVDGVIDGTLSLSVVGQGHERTADLMFILKSDMGVDHYGLPGLGLLMPGDVAIGGGYHGGLNPIELNSVLILAGGDMPSGVVTSAPAGIIDIAPTVLAMLNLQPAASMQGRNLMRKWNHNFALQTVAASHGAFHQSVSFIDVGRARYVQHGGQAEATYAS